MGGYEYMEKAYEKNFNFLVSKLFINCMKNIVIGSSLPHFENIK